MLNYGVAARGDQQPLPRNLFIVNSLRDKYDRDGE